jgi:hypothetical protein
MVTRTLTQIEDCHWVAAAKGKPGDNLDAADTGTIINLET